MDQETHIVNLILDHSAFVRGIGNIKRWFNETQYATAQVPVVLNVYVPAYTLHELDFGKKGISMLATNARESIRFIDKITSDYDLESPMNSNLTYNVFLESPNEAGPSWSDSLKFKKRAPRIKEFPNHKTTFETSTIGRENVQYEHELQRMAMNEERRAEIPQRLKYLVRTSIYKQFLEQPDKKDWKVVTEDPITKIWLSSFSIDCINVNEAELSIFGKDQPRNEVDTSTYDYTHIHEKKTRRKKINVIEVAATVPKSESGIFDNKIRKEKFDAISYAPRGSGELWTP